jgi:uncharacterized protein (DUF427 family)
MWDYPRPPRVEPARKPVKVIFNGVVVARSDRGLRVLETASPPTYYVPADDVVIDLLKPVAHTTVCKWKGVASYYDVVVGDQTARRAVWTYPSPKRAFAGLAAHFSFYPGRVEAFLGDERVRPQPGRFYGGWVTDDIVGPFQGGTGTGQPKLVGLTGTSRRSTRPQGPGRWAGPLEIAPSQVPGFAG